MITEEGYGAMFRKLIISTDYGSKLGTQTNLNWMLECRWYFEMDSFDSLYERTNGRKEKSMTGTPVFAKLWSDPNPETTQMLSETRKYCSNDI